MVRENKIFPLEIKIGFKKVFDAYRDQLEADDFRGDRAEEIGRIEREFPKLSSGLTTFAELSKYADQIDTLLSPLFPSTLGRNEVKFATVPYHRVDFKSTDRYKKIIAAAGEDFDFDLINFNDDQFYIMGCSLILHHYYGYNVDFRRSFYYNIPDARGLMKNYRVMYNADFIEIHKKKGTKDITEEDLNELLESFRDIAVWKEKFPPKSWVFNGFVIASLFDVTMDVSISDFKTNLLRLETNGGFENTEFSRIFRSIFNLPELKIGFTDYNEELKTFERTLYKQIDSFILNGEKVAVSENALCSASYYTLFKQKEFYCITDAERYNKMYPDNLLYKKMLEQGMKSAIFASIVKNDKVLGVLELVSPNANDLNTINANKLRDVMPFLIDSVVRSKENLENELELIVQEECTAIHSSVHWKFRKEAKRYLNSIADGNPTYFREIVFQDVHPLYGQTDIKGSSEARNEATKKDLALQMEYISEVIKKLQSIQSLPILEQMEFNITEFMKEINENLQVDTERKILKFLSAEIIPFFEYLGNKDEKYRLLIAEYNNLIDHNTGLVYKHRKDYDQSVMLVNKRLASVLDRQQRVAQLMFPHYFERFKTDGVEHNLYIGKSIAKEKSFNQIYLRNLRLWQLQVMCEMENNFYKFKENLPLALDVASMVLVFNGTLSLRFRMDEKRFDVDGTYNARYEVVKKRVDKAHIKGSPERVTQPGKIAIIYSQKEDEEEYLQYIAFLQHQKVLDNNLEMVELEELQGVTGLKAIRVGILYSKNNDNAKEYYTYEDLISELHG